MKKLISSLLAICLFVCGAVFLSGCNEADLNLWNEALNLEVNALSAQQQMNAGEKLFAKLELAKEHKYVLELSGENVSEGNKNYVSKSLYNPEGKVVSINNNGELKTNTAGTYYLLLQRNNENVVSTLRIKFTPVHSHNEYGLCSCGDFVGTEFNEGVSQTVDLSMDGTNTTKLCFKVNVNHTNGVAFDAYGMNLENTTMKVFNSNGNQLQVREVAGNPKAFIATSLGAYYVLIEYGNSTGSVVYEQITFREVLDN